VGGIDEPAVLFPDELEPPPPQAEAANAKADANTLKIMRGLCFFVTEVLVAFACLRSGDKTVLMRVSQNGTARLANL
jgi:hypothetical protein